VWFRITALGQVRCQNKRDTEHFGAGPVAIFRNNGQLHTTLLLVILSFHGNGEDRVIARVGHLVYPYIRTMKNVQSRTPMTMPACWQKPLKSRSTKFENAVLQLLFGIQIFIFRFVYFYTVVNCPCRRMDCNPLINKLSNP
jgi:hypothetical protein